MEILSDRERFELEVIDSVKWTLAQRKKKLIKWAIRQILTVALFYWLWDRPWIRYFLWVWLPLAVLNLLGILFYNWWIEQKFKKLKRNKQGEPAE